LGSGLPLPEDDNTIWKIKLGYLHPGISKVEYINFNSKNEVIVIPNYNGHDWIKFNAAQSGFYRVRYSSNLSSKLGLPIQSLLLSPGDRLGIVNDYFALSQAGLLPLTEVFALIENFRNESFLLCC